MIWLIGEINKHIVHDVEGNWIGTFKDEEIAAEVVNAHNNGSLIPNVFNLLTKIAENSTYGKFASGPPLISAIAASEATDAKLAASNGWTNSTKGWSR